MSKLMLSIMSNAGRSRSPTLLFAEEDITAAKQNHQAHYEEGYGIGIFSVIRVTHAVPEGSVPTDVAHVTAMWRETIYGASRADQEAVGRKGKLQC
jgi:hypothetical protein